VNALERCLHSTLGRACYHGLWFSPEREALQALVTETQRDVTGVVRLKLYKGNIIVVGPQKPQESVRPENRNDGRRGVVLQPKRRHRIHSLKRAAIETPGRDKVIFAGKEIFALSRLR